ncbi:MAG TPA: hypothetical protein VGK29_25670 [Paludibaculum sp.]|jgi:hypothetical protein
MTWQIAVLALAMGAVSMLQAGVAEIRKEPDPLKRFEAALALAETRTKAARQLVKESGSRTELMAVLEEVEEASVLSLQSLQATGKRPHSLTKQYKKGELKTMEMLRILKDLVTALSMDDRPAAEKVRDQAEVTHEEYLLGVMSGK